MLTYCYLINYLIKRNLLLKCYNDKRSYEWNLAILKTYYTTAKDFVIQQPFGSFAPVRKNSKVKWFVDGSDYMSSIADSIDNAKEEIFITGFFLTPEIYLKRPQLENRWRLDKLLKHKAVNILFIK